MLPNFSAHRLVVQLLEERVAAASLASDLARHIPQQQALLGTSSA
jgi:hypothetical protein